MAVKSSVPTISHNRVKPRISEEEYRHKLGLRRLTEFGAEMPDSTPMAPPVGYKKQPSIFENMRAMVQAELSRKAREQGFESEEEAEDFEEPDDMPLSRHEYTEMQEEHVRHTVNEFNRKVAADKRKAAAKAATEAASAPPRAPVKGAEGAGEALDSAPLAGATRSHSAD